MDINFLFDVIKESKSKDAIIWKDKSYSYERLSNMINQCEELLDSEKVVTEMVVAIKSDFSPHTIAMFLALIDRSCIIVPLTNTRKNNEDELLSIAQVNFIINIAILQTY